MIFSFNLKDSIKGKLNLKEDEKPTKRMNEIFTRYHDLISGYTNAESILKREKEEGRIT